MKYVKPKKKLIATSDKKPSVVNAAYCAGHCVSGEVNCTTEACDICAPYSW